MINYRLYTKKGAMPNPSKLIIALLLLVTYFTIFRTRISQETKPILSEHVPVDYHQIIKEKSTWRTLLQNSDSSQFYEELKNAYKNNYNQHIIGHIFGDLLYEKEGVNGIEVCDHAFYWGCYHAITSSAIANEGVQVINELNKICKENSSSSAICNHGIGHGLVEFFGPNRLLSALEMCDTIGGSESCYTGVFMQHNFPSASDKNGLDTQVRPLIYGHEFSPCGRLPQKYDLSCYAELPRWWDRIYSSDFSRMGFLCSGIKDKKFSGQCFAGIGDMVSLLEEPSLEKTLTVCQQLPSSFGKNTCLVYASLGFASDMYNQDKALPVCFLASPEYQAQCLKN